MTIGSELPIILSSDWSNVSYRDIIGLVWSNCSDVSWRNNIAHCNVETVESLGADRVIDYKNEDFAKEKNKYNIIFDAVGKSSYGAAKKALKEKGIYLTTVPTPGVMIQALLKKKSVKRRASFMAAGLRKPHIKIKDLEYLEALVREGEVHPLHGRIYNLKELGEAQVYVETGHKVGNVTIDIIGSMN